MTQQRLCSKIRSSLDPASSFSAPVLCPEGRVEYERKGIDGALMTIEEHLRAHAELRGRGQAALRRGWAAGGKRCETTIIKPC